MIGAATAFSHTFSAIIIGVLALSTTGQIATTQYLRWVGLPSGILTVGLGIWLLRRHFTGDSTEHHHEHAQDESSGLISDHSHPHQHTAPSLDRVSLVGLIAMGLAHGIVPTFDALAILLVAMTVEQTGLGIGLILMYSLGIGVTMIAIGALFLRAQKVLIDNPRFDFVSRWSPVLAASVVVLLGFWLIVRTWGAG